MEFPKLYHKARTGKLVTWRIWTEGAEVCTEHGTDDGKKQISRYMAQPKNVGKKNAVDAEGQAMFEAGAKWQYQLDRKYSTTPEDAAEVVFLPMLAHSYEGKKKQVYGGDKLCRSENFVPCDIQPKLDGVRCMAYNDQGTIILLSRQGKEWQYVPHVASELSWLPEGDCIDGELYIHGKGFQTITSWCKGKNKEPHPESHNIEYHVYDYPVVASDGDWGTWAERRKKLSEVQTSEHVVVVQTKDCESPEDISEHHQAFCAEGYEGAILRVRNGRYQLGFRSPDLLKVKSFQDAEYVIVDAICGKEGSKEDGKVIWVCESSGKRFNVRSTGTMEERAELYQNRSSYIGQLLKVKFFELTDDGLPRFPVGLGIRSSID